MLPGLRDKVGVMQITGLPTFEDGLQLLLQTAIVIGGCTSNL